MTTKNWRAINCLKALNPQNFPYNIILTNVNGVDTTVSSSGTYGSKPVTTIDEIDTSSNNNICTSYTGQYQYVNIVAGSGNRPASEDDYMLETPLSLTYSGKTIVPIYDENHLPIGVNFVKTWINNTGADVTIREIGALLNFGTSNSASTTILIERTVLETPVVVASGDTVSLSFKMFY